jgi:hypothetical protein
MRALNHPPRRLTNGYRIIVLHRWHFIITLNLSDRRHSNSDHAAPCSTLSWQSTSLSLAWSACSTCENTHRDQIHSAISASSAVTSLRTQPQLPALRRTAVESREKCQDWSDVVFLLLRCFLWGKLAWLNLTDNPARIEVRNRQGPLRPSEIIHPKHQEPKAQDFTGPYSRNPFRVARGLMCSKPSGERWRRSWLAVMLVMGD